MRLFIFCNDDKPVIPGTLKDVEVCNVSDISDKTNYFYSSVESFGFIETCRSENPFDQLLNKIDNKGYLKVVGIDIYQAAEALRCGEINSEEFSNLVVKENHRVTSLHLLVSHLQTRPEFAIEHAGIAGLNYILKVIRV
tara:strand:- start:1002 stop:1418 length:417 start_codon:yes stop_codon:yes gene_type:complete